MSGDVLQQQLHQPAAAPRRRCAGSTVGVLASVVTLLASVLVFLPAAVHSAPTAEARHQHQAADPDYYYNGYDPNYYYNNLDAREQEEYKGESAPLQNSGLWNSS